MRGRKRRAFAVRHPHPRQGIARHAHPDPSRQFASPDYGADEIEVEVCPVTALYREQTSHGQLTVRVLVSTASTRTRGGDRYKDSFHEHC